MKNTTAGPYRKKDSVVEATYKSVTKKQLTLINHNYLHIFSGEEKAKNHLRVLYFRIPLSTNYIDAIDEDRDNVYRLSL